MKNFYALNLVDMARTTAFCVKNTVTKDDGVVGVMPVFGNKRQAYKAAARLGCGVIHMQGDFK